MDFPKDLKYTENDEWVRVEGKEAVCGISDFAQDQLQILCMLKSLSLKVTALKKAIH